MKVNHVFLFLIATALCLHADPNLLIDGSESVVIDPPQEVYITADFSSPGQSLTVRLFIDQNSDRILNLTEMDKFMKIIDGVPPIGWLTGDHIRGDLDSTANGEMTYVTVIDMDPPLSPIRVDTIYFFLVAKDDGDGSVDTAIMKVIPPEPDIEPEIPYIYGTVYSAEDSAEVVYPAYCVLAESDIDPVLTDSTGRFFIAVPERDSSYMIQAIPLDGDHIVASTIVEFGSMDDSVRADITCPVLSQHIRGNITLDGGTPVPGFFIILAFNTTTYSVTAAIHNQITGEYRVPAMPGSTRVGFLDYESFPAGYFGYPARRDILVPDTGDVYDIDFDLRHLDAAISGTVIDSSIHGDAENEGLWIYADADDFGDFVARTAEDGSFLISVKGAGGDSTYNLTLETYGYDVYPWEYDDISVEMGDTVTGYNFVLGEAWIDNSISGNVVDIDEDPVDSAIVIVNNNELAFKKAWQMTYTDSFGEYSFENLPAWEGSWFVGTYKESLGIQEPRLIIIENLPDDTTITDADFVFSLSGIDEQGTRKPGQFAIGVIYPNPFNGIARAVIVIPDNMPEIDISLHDILGRKRRELFRGQLIEGEHTLNIDCRGLPSGIYYLRAQSKEIIESKELIYIK